jgi:heat shock protein HtpX
LQTLSKDEIEAVLAHELTHIQNRDVRLMVVASIFAGLFTLIGACISGRTSGSESGNFYYFGGSSRRHHSGDTDDDDGESDSSGLGLLYGLLSILVGIVMLGLVHISSIITHLAISRRREYLADAGAAELTKNPDALIRALQKITGRDDMHTVPDTMQAMMISRTMDGFLSTHPAVSDRVQALVQFAGGRTTTPTAARRTPRVGGIIPGARPIGVSGLASGGLAAAGFTGSGFAGGGPVSFGRRQPRFASN